MAVHLIRVVKTTTVCILVPVHAPNRREAERLALESVKRPDSVDKFPPPSPNQIQYGCSYDRYVPDPDKKVT